MKSIRWYKQIEIGVDENGEPIITLAPQHIDSTDAGFANDYAIAKAEAYNGEVTVEDEPDDRPLDVIRADKLAELSSSCNAAITAGMDVETTQGTEHFSLQETDQINLTTALSAIQNGSTGYPYHADGQLCRLFSAKEIQDIAEASIKHKLYHTTLCNHLMTWVRRIEDKKELANVKYSIENLPQDLKQNMIDILEKTV